MKKVIESNGMTDQPKSSQCENSTTSKDDKRLRLPTIFEYEAWEDRNGNYHIVGKLWRGKDREYKLFHCTASSADKALALYLKDIPDLRVVK